MTELMIEWYRWAMCDGPFPAFLRDHVVYYVAGVEEWRWAPDLAAITHRIDTWHLHGHNGPHSGAHPGWLSTTAADTPSFEFVCDPDERTTLELERQPRPTAQSSNPIVVLPPYHLNLADHLAGGDPTTRAFVASIDGFGAVYTSEVLRESVEFAGRPELDLWLTVDQPDVDLAAMLYELRADGTSILLSPALQRLRHRDPSKGIQLLEPGVPTLVTLKNFHWFARRVAAGSRLQLAVRHTGSIHLDRNHHTGRPDGTEMPDDVRVARVSILHEGHHRSTLRLPIAAAWDTPSA
jgi:predicted acyl esterase